MMRKSRPHKQASRTTYTWLDVLNASPTDPMPEATRRAWMGKMRGALHSMQVDESPPISAWRDLSDAVNLVETMLDAGMAQDEDGIKHRCITAMAIAGARHVDEGKRLGLDGPGIHALQALLDDFEAILEELPHREVVKVHMATEKRVQKILAGKSTAAHVVVAV